MRWWRGKRRRRMTPTLPHAREWVLRLSVATRRTLEPAYENGSGATARHRRREEKEIDDGVGAEGQRSQHTTPDDPKVW